MEKEITVELAIGTCKACGNKRDIYRISGFLYGWWLLLTEDGKYYSYRNCFEDTAFNEVSSILDSLIKRKRYNQNQKADCFHEIFGVSCDLINGTKIDVCRTHAACLFCGSTELSIKENHPSDFKKVILPVVTHQLWDRLNSQEKRTLVSNELLLKGYNLD